MPQAYTSYEVVGRSQSVILGYSELDSASQFFKSF